VSSVFWFAVPGFSSAAPFSGAPPALAPGFASALSPGAWLAPAPPAPGPSPGPALTFTPRRAATRGPDSAPVHAPGSSRGADTLRLPAPEAATVVSLVSPVGEVSATT